jgi:hypothetical protein
MARVLAASLLSLFLVAGCAAPAASPGPTSAPGSADPSQPPTADPSPLTTVTPTTSPSANPDDLGVTWTTVTDLPKGSDRAAVAAWGSGWIAVASEVLRSTDGRTWARVSTLAASATAVAATTTSLVAVGTADSVVAGQTSMVATGIVWRSFDGTTWDVIGTGSVFALGPCLAGCPRMEAIAVGAGGIVVAGYGVTPNGPPSGLETDVWHSADETSWQRTPLPGPAAGGFPAAEVWVTARDRGFMAAGAVCNTDGTSCRAVTWSSPDGRTWAPPIDLPNGAGAGASRIVTGPAGYVVLGQRCNGDPCRLAVWASVDGVTWKEGVLDGTNQISPDTRGLLAATGDRFVVVGSKDGGISAWISRDGLAWDRKAHDPASFGATTGNMVTGLDMMIVDLGGGPTGVVATGDGAGGPRFWVSP